MNETFSWIHQNKNNLIGSFISLRSSGNKATGSLSPVAEAQEALSNLNLQVQKIEASLQAVRSIKTQTARNQNDSSISKKSETILTYTY